MQYLSSTLAILATGLALSGAIEFPRYRITLSDSLPRGVYQETHESVHRGVIVAECLPPDLATFGKERGYLDRGKCPGNVVPILKQVVGMPGDIITVNDAFVAVNDKIIFNTETRAVDSKGRPIPAKHGTFLLQPDEVFLLGTHSERSWDNRYTGPAKIVDVIAVLKPVWTETD